MDHMCECGVVCEYVVCEYVVCLYECEREMSYVNRYIYECMHVWLWVVLPHFQSPLAWNFFAEKHYGLKIVNE